MERERPIKYRRIATGFEGGGSHLASGDARHSACDLPAAVRAPVIRPAQRSFYQHGLSNDVSTTCDRQQTQHGAANAGRPELAYLSQLYSRGDAPVLTLRRELTGLDSRFPADSMSPWAVLCNPQSVGSMSQATCIRGSALMSRPMTRSLRCSRMIVRAVVSQNSSVNPAHPDRSSSFLHAVALLT